MSVKLFLTDTNAVLDGTGAQVAADWTALSDTEKETLFTTKGSTASTFTGLSGKVKVLAYSTFSTATHTATLVGAPFPQLVKPSGLISVANYEAIESVNITYDVSSTASLKIAVTLDGTTYKAWSGTAWVTVDATNATTFATNAMDVSAVATITAAQWLLLNPKTNIGFAYLITTSASTDKCATDLLSLTVDMKGTWSKAIHGTDYTYSYSNTALSVKVLVAGSYKVNYVTN